MTFPALFTVGWHTAADGALDAEGNPVVSYTPALDAAGTDVKVMGWAPAKTDEPQIDRVVHDIDLYVPPSTSVGSGDHVDLPEGQFEVVGEPLDWTRGPFGFMPGMVVKLKKVTG